MFYICNVYQRRYQSLSFSSRDENCMLLMRACSQSPNMHGSALLLTRTVFSHWLRTQQSGSHSWSWQKSKNLMARIGVKKNIFYKWNTGAGEGGGGLSVKGQFVKTEDSSRDVIKFVLFPATSFVSSYRGTNLLGIQRVGKDTFNRGTIITEEIVRAKESNRSIEP